MFLIFVYSPYSAKVAIFLSLGIEVGSFCSIIARRKMGAYTPITTCAKNVVCLIGNVRRQRVVRVSPRSSCYFYTGVKKDSRLSCFSTNAKSRGFQEFQSEPGCHSLTFKGPARSRNTSVSVSSGHEKMSPRLLLSRQAQVSRVRCDVGPFSWSQGSVTGALFMGLVVCFSTSRPSYAEGSETRESSTSGNSNNKKVLTNYFVIGIPGDGRCLFRSVAHGACIRLGNSAPDENAQRKLADELRAQVADEFIKRREETEWFIEGDFDEYISQMRKPHVWGGEPELLMASHVLQMPITVYMHDKDSGGLISIAEYGQEYGKDDPIRVLYHGCGHYDALHFPGAGGVRPRL